MRRAGFLNKREGTANCSTKCTTGAAPDRDGFPGAGGRLAGSGRGPPTPTRGCPWRDRGPAGPGAVHIRRRGAFLDPAATAGWIHENPGACRRLRCAHCFWCCPPSRRPPAREWIPSPRTGPAAGPGTVAAGWSWPLNPRPAVLRAFDPPARPWLSGHRGVDLRATHDGAPVTSPASGTVSFRRRCGGPSGHHHRPRQRVAEQFEAVRSDLKAGAAVAEGRPGVGPARPLHAGALRPLGRSPRRGIPQSPGLRDRPAALRPASSPRSRTRVGARRADQDEGRRCGARGAGPAGGAASWGRLAPRGRS